MKRAKKSLRVVIDASVARAAGSSSDPTASACREILQEILDVCHRVVFSQEIKAEWRRHESRFFLQWRTAMVGKKKQVVVSSLPTESVIDQIEANAGGSAARKAMIKDAHLVAAAVAADRIIITRDEDARRRFESLAASCKELGLVWLNPCNPEECSLLSPRPAD